ncbi:hypothetical protein DWY72_14530 [Phocaeicola plebeius]|jgi:hypothetical protein|uniref:hypothetical protein n=1 Tax=Phocaeicola plebeius TaxID=310297 RepID=UPI000E5244CF|nr:hypothetical protein [Phocaeicola plebeius]RGQ68851.1 hypothetical protein DWY86_14750 [Phocaeicola plebeius]RGQ89199.1 hypothetical protein DWY72_14530 [Phocaeicola plebeius]
MGCLSFITLSIFIFLVTVFLIGCIEYPLLGWFTLLVIMPGIILVWRKGYVVRSVLKTKPEEKYRDKVLKQAKELDLFMFDAKKGLEYDVFWKIGIHDDSYTNLRKNNNVEHLLLMTNRLGCEVFFRKIADYDTEKEEYTHDVFKAVLDKLREDSLKLRGIEFLNQL